MADSKVIKAVANNYRDAYILESLADFYRASDVLAKAPELALNCKMQTLSPTDGLVIMSNLTKALKRNSDASVSVESDECSSASLTTRGALTHSANSSAHIFCMHSIHPG